MANKDVYARMASTLREIARRAKVHQSTVSHIVNGGGGSTRVSDETRSRVLEVASALGYKANRAAQQLRTRRSRVVGLLTGDVENPFFARQVAFCAEALEVEGYDVVLATRRRDETHDQHLLNALTSHQFDGLLLWSETSTEVREAVQRPSLVNTVVMGYQIPGRDCVYARMESAIGEALNHLADQGCRRIAYFAPEFALDRAGDPRHDTYLHWAKSTGHIPTIIAYNGSAYDLASPRVCAENLAKSIAAGQTDGTPDAFLCFNDMAATAALMGLRRQGLRVPHDIALVGFDGLPLAAELDVPLSTVAYPIEEVCYSAVQLLMDRLRAKKSGALLPPRDVPLDARLIIRESSLRNSTDGSTSATKFPIPKSHGITKG